ncbi:hypothetical protein [Streptomyces sp. NPDC051183]|uniref:hypothetical protein n=1 Tax=Streptomyces sp. NPDC051183 TaxID=3155165 RepID=UPI00343374CB
MIKNSLRGLTVLTLAFASLLAPSLAAPASASSNIHFYAFEDPTRLKKTIHVDVVDGWAATNEHRIGVCKSIRVGRDFFNETGRIIQLFRVAGCAGNPDFQLEDGQELANGPGFQSVLVIR